MSRLALFPLLLLAFGLGILVGSALIPAPPAEAANDSGPGRYQLRIGSGPGNHADLGWVIDTHTGRVRTLQFKDAHSQARAF